MEFRVCIYDFVHTLQRTTFIRDAGKFIARLPEPSQVTLKNLRLINHRNQIVFALDAFQKRAALFISLSPLGILTSITAYPPDQIPIHRVY